MKKTELFSLVNHVQRKTRDKKELFLLANHIKEHSFVFITICLQDFCKQQRIRNEKFASSEKLDKWKTGLNDGRARISNLGGGA